jgi:hypothetical protein
MNRADRRKRDQELEKQKEEQEKKVLNARIEKLEKTVKRKKVTAWSIFAGLCLIAATWVAVHPYWRDVSKTEKEKFDDQTKEVGKIKSPVYEEYRVLEQKPVFKSNPITDSFPTLDGVSFKDTAAPVIPVQIGGKVYLVKPLIFFQGIEFTEIQPCDSVNSRLQLFAKDGRLYVSAKFIDLKTDELIGDMAFNRWTLYKGAFKDYHPGEDRFEVIDHQGNIVFSIQFKFYNRQPWVLIGGYFVTPRAVTVMNNSVVSKGGNSFGGVTNQCFSKSESDWQNKALTEILKIKTLFPEHNKMKD